MFDAKVTTTGADVGKVLIVEDVREARDWMAGLVEKAFGGDRAPLDIRKAATMNQGLRECEAALSEGAFDVALIDLSLPDGNGFNVLRALGAKSPETRSVVTTILAADSDIVAALAAGAQGYLLKDQPEHVIVQQLSQMMAGVPAISPPIARRIMRHFRLTGPIAEPESQLTEREMEVLSLIARGQRVSDAAAALEVAESTIASHIKSIYRKLGISTRAEAAFHAARMGLIE